MTANMKLSLMDHYVKKMTMMLANEFDLSVESAMQFVLSSSSFKDLHEKTFLLEEGDLFLFDLLKKEFLQNPNH
jgi:hypothetical protein